MNLDTVREISVAINASHRFIYVVPEGVEEAAAFGVAPRGLAGPPYFAFRAAALGAVPWQVVAATFYNWSPGEVRSMLGVWDAAPPPHWQAGRFRAAGRALHRADVHLSLDQIAEARSLIDPVVAGADYAGRPLAAANASLALPADPLTALWQQITVLREWRGDAHVVTLQSTGLGPCDCLVIQTATGRHPTAAVARATRGWSDQEWSEATARLTARGWLNSDGTVNDTGTTARENVEVETDQYCAALWTPLARAVRDGWPR